MPWTQAKASSAGTKNPIVARLFIQVHDTLEHCVVKRGDKGKILAQMRIAKDEVLSCEAALTALRREWEPVGQRIKEGGIRRSGSSLECPQVHDLERYATQFVTSAKRALQAAGEVYNEFYAPPKGGLVKNGNFSFAIKHLATQQPPNSDYLAFLNENEAAVQTLVGLRNGQEHPEDASKTVIENVRLTADGFVPPTWRRLPSPPTPILEEMEAALPFLVDFIESNFFFGFLENAESQGWPRRLIHIPGEQRDPNCPMAYHLVYVHPNPGSTPASKPPANE